MTKTGSIKETGEELPEKDWRQFEAAVGVGKERDGDVRTDQPFRDVTERSEGTGSDTTRPDDAGTTSGSGTPKRPRNGRSKLCAVRGRVIV